MVTTCPNCTPDPRDNIPPELADTRSRAFGELLGNLTNESMSLPTVAELAHITLYQLSVWSELPATSEAIRRIKGLQLTRISLTAALNGTQAVARLHHLMYDTPPETSRKAAGAILRLIDHPEDAIKPDKTDDDDDNTGNSTDRDGPKPRTPPEAPEPEGLQVRSQRLS